MIVSFQSDDPIHKQLDTLEIEVDGNHDTDMLRNHRLIAGWCPDGSLHHDGSLEYQSEPMTMSQLTEIRRLVERIATDNNRAVTLDQEIEKLRDSSKI